MTDRLSSCVARLLASLCLAAVPACLFAGAAAPPASAQEPLTPLASADAAASGAAAPADQFWPRPIGFTPCPENASLECGTLTVPVDYRKPHGETVGIGVIRARATNPAKRIGIAVGNPGGPGISGVDAVLGVIQLPPIVRLRERFDIIGFDPRGVGRSRQVQCTLDAGEIPVDAGDAALAAYFDDLAVRHAQACLRQNGAFVTKIGTTNVARDIDLLRRALGERQITYTSGSYGSELGAVYASLFPERVRAMLLDGAIAPEFRDYAVENWAEFSGAFEMAFQRLDQVCRRDAACRLADGGVVTAYDDLAARLKNAPVTSPDGGVLTLLDLQEVTATLIDVEPAWPTLVDALADARGGDYALLLALVPFTGSTPSALFPISCNDYGTRRPAAEYLPVDEAIGALSPRFFGRFFVASSTALCAAWAPADPPIIRNVRGRVATPILVVGNDFDSRTPLSSARRLAHALGMERSLMRYMGSGHTAFAKTTACIQDAIETYLVDLRVPPEGFACPGRAIEFETTSTTTRGMRFKASDLTPGFWGSAPARPRPASAAR